MRHIAIDHVYLARFGRVDPAAIGDRATPADDDEQVVARMSVRHEALAGTHLDDVRAEIPIADRRLARGMTVGHFRAPAIQADPQELRMMMGVVADRVGPCDDLELVRRHRWLEI